MDLLTALLAAVIGYACGSLSFSRIVARFVSPGRDIRDYESPIPGSSHTYRLQAVSATTVGLQLGRKWGMTVSILDMLKVAIPVLTYRILYPDHPYHLIVSVMGLVGHNWPIYYGFKGGRGLSAIYGGLLVTDWLGVLVTSVVAMVAGMAVLFSYLGSLVLLIPWMIFRWHSWPYTVYAILINVIFAVAMIPDAKAAQESRRIRKQAGEDVGDPWADETSPMGKMLTSWGRRRGLLKPGPEDKDSTPNTE